MKITAFFSEKSPQCAGLGFLLFTSMIAAACGSQPSLSGREQTVNSATQTDTSQPAIVFDRVWQAAKNEIYDEERARKFFTDENYNRLLVEARQQRDISGLSTEVLNPFLKTLGVSHTRFYTRDDLGLEMSPSVSHLEGSSIGLYGLKCKSKTQQPKEEQDGTLRRNRLAWQQQCDRATG